MDKTLAMSDVMLGEPLLEHAGLTSTERLMVMTSTSNDLAFDKVAEALVKQNALTKESTRNQHSGKGKGGKTEAHWRNNASRGFLAYDEEWEYDHPQQVDIGHGEAYLGYDTSSYDGWESWDTPTAWYQEEGTWDQWGQAHADEETADSHGDPAMAAAKLQMAYLAGDYCQSMMVSTQHRSLLDYKR